MSTNRYAETRLLRGLLKFCLVYEYKSWASYFVKMLPFSGYWEILDVIIIHSLKLNRIYSNTFIYSHLQRPSLLETMWHKRNPNDTIKIFLRKRTPFLLLNQSWVIRLDSHTSCEMWRETINRSNCVRKPV